MWALIKRGSPLSLYSFTVIGDTIFAVASPPGAAERGVLRISGPRALQLAGEVVESELPPRRSVLETAVHILGHRVPCLVLVMPGPGSYTGEDVVELHLPGSPLLLEKLGERLRPAGRDALPGEFTRRAYENGRLGLTEAEAVLDLIHAATQDDRAKALDMLEGGLSESVDGVRSLVQDALALLESGLDFTEGETGTVAAESWLRLLRTALQMVQSMETALPQARTGGEVLLVGAGNAGKSSLCNALAGEQAVLTAEGSGTTRDVLRVPLTDEITLLDAPGDVEDPSVTEARALDLRDRVAHGCDAALLVVDLTAPLVVHPRLPVLATVLTKVDLVPELPATLERSLPAAPRFLVCNHTGQGLEQLRRFLLQRVGGGPSGRGNRVRDILARSRLRLADAVTATESGEPVEIVAVELGEVLGLLDEVHGRSTPEDLLDRIFSRFCLGK